jgi:hypothetical protein
MAIQFIVLRALVYRRYRLILSVSIGVILTVGSSISQASGKSLHRNNCINNSLELSVGIELLEFCQMFIQIGFFKLARTFLQLCHIMIIDTKTV